MALKVYTASTVTPFLLAEVKDHLHIRGNEEDDYIQQLIFASVDVAEALTRRALFTQTLDYYVDFFTAYEILLPKPPLQSVTFVKYHDGSAYQTVNAADYQVDTLSEPGRVSPLPSGSWPSPESGRFNAVHVRYVAGYGDVRGSLPADIRQGMLYCISHWFDVREPVVIGTIAQKVPFTAASLFASKRVMRFF